MVLFSSCFSKAIFNFASLQKTCFKASIQNFIITELHTTSLLCRKPGMIFKRPVDFNWRFEKSGVNKLIEEEGDYTHKALPYPKHGGRGPDGHAWYKHVGGGLEKNFFLVDLFRAPNADGSTRAEKVIHLRDAPYRSYKIALTVSGQRKSWRIATSSLKVGDIIYNHAEIPRSAFIPRPNDAYPIGALSPGTEVCLLEGSPGSGAQYGRSAGAKLIVTRKWEEANAAGTGVVRKVAARLGSGREVVVDERCQCVVGQVSNEDWAATPWRKFGEVRWYGRRQRGGLRQKKDGRFGRRIHPRPLPPVDLTLGRHPLPTFDIKIHMDAHNPVEEKKPKPVHYYGPKQPTDTFPLRDPDYTGRPLEQSDVHLWYRKATVVDPSGRTRN